jgi:DNA polymerase III delta' subunit
MKLELNHHITIPKLSQLILADESRLFLMQTIQNPGSITFLFVGPEGSGKKTAAFAMIRSLFCQTPHEVSPCRICQQVLNKVHPDMVWVENEEGKNKLTVEQVRGLQKKISVLPLTADFHVVVIPEAELLNLEAQNALLKTLEEPPANTITILISKQTGSLLPTVLSRCRMVRFRPYTVAELKKILMTHWNWNESEAQQAASQCNGNLLSALQFSDSRWDDFSTKVVADFDRSLSSHAALFIACIHEYEQWEPDILEISGVTPTQRKSRVFQTALQVYSRIWERRLRGEESIPASLDLLAPIFVLECLQQHIDLLETYLSPRMIIDHFFITLRNGFQTGYLEKKSLFDWVAQL